MDDLKAKLAVQEAELKQKNENADKLIHVVGVETEKVSKEKAIADEEEIKVEVINKVGGGAAPLGQVPCPSDQYLPAGPGNPAGLLQGGHLPQTQAPDSAEGCPPGAQQWHLLSW